LKGIPKENSSNPVTLGLPVNATARMGLTHHLRKGGAPGEEVLPATRGGSG